MNWMNFGFKDVVDVLLVAVLMYQLFRAFKTSGSKSLYMGVIAFMMIWFLVSQVLKMKLLGTIMDTVATGGVVLIVILFQDDIKRFLMALGSKERWKGVSNIFKKQDEENQSLNRQVSAITLACLNMSRKMTGALIVVQQRDGLDQYEHTGERINADVNARLIENIFFKNSPLHDGAMIIYRNRITAAGCILPVSHSSAIPKDLGLRHRSGLGMAMATDAKVVIVSEERGKISVAQDGKLRTNVSIDDLQKFLLDTDVM